MAEGKDGKVVNLFTRQTIRQPSADAQNVDSGGTPITPDLEVSESENDDAAFYKTHHDLVTRAVTEAGTIEKMISRIQGFSRNERNIGIRLQGLRETPLSALCESLTRSTQSMWKEKPSYYLAVIAELSHRIDTMHRSTPGTERERATSDALFTMSNHVRVLSARRQTDTITEYIMDECGIQPNHAEMALHQSIVSRHTLSQLCDLMLDSSKDDWASRPNFFGAVITVLDERLSAVREILLQGKNDEEDRDV